MLDDSAYVFRFILGLELLFNVLHAFFISLAIPNTVTGVDDELLATCSLFLLDYWLRGDGL